MRTNLRFSASQEIFKFINATIRFCSTCSSSTYFNLLADSVSQTFFNAFTFSKWYSRANIFKTVSLS